MSFSSNHSIGLLVASSFTLVGFMLTSTGPAIKVKLAGEYGLLSSDMMAVAAKQATVGWHTAIKCVLGPITFKKLMMCST